MPQNVFVTGASGYIAKHLIAQLLEAGHSVVGSVRSMSRGAEVRAAVTPHVTGEIGGRLSFVALDLDSDAGWQDAMQGCDVLIHTASPFPMVQPKDEQDAIRPAVQGALRALRAARAVGIGRVIMTSSSAAISSSDLPAGQEVYTEEHWTDPDHPTATAYVKSKMLAERAAWDFVRDEAPELQLTVINPSFVLGAPLDENFGTSIKVIERLLAGTDPMLPRFGFTCVDVRDVAAMHIAAMEQPETAGKRFIGANGFLWFQELGQLLKADHPGRKIPTRQAPNFVVRILSLFDPAIRTVLPSLGRRDETSGARARAELGIAFRDVRQAVRDTGAYLVEHKIV